MISTVVTSSSSLNDIFIRLLDEMYEKAPSSKPASGGASTLDGAPQPPAMRMVVTAIETTTFKLGNLVEQYERKLKELCHNFASAN